MIVSTYQNSSLSQNSSLDVVHAVTTSNPMNVTRIGDASSRLFQDGCGRIVLREKTLAEVIGEKVLRPVVDTTSFTLSRIFSLIGKFSSFIPSLPCARAEEVPLKASVDPTVREALLGHLTNVHYELKEQPVILGTEEQLETVAKIISFPPYPRIIDYPPLSNRQYLVGSVDRFVEIRVIAVYNSEQMHDIQKQVDRGYANWVTWNILEIDERLEKELLQEILSKPLEIELSVEKFQDSQGNLVPGIAVIRESLVPKGSAKAVPVGQLEEQISAIFNEKNPSGSKKGKVQDL